MIELDVEQLPEGEEVLTILKQENAPLHTWLALGVSIQYSVDSLSVEFSMYRCFQCIMLEVKLKGGMFAWYL